MWNRALIVLSCFSSELALADDHSKPPTQADQSACSRMNCGDDIVEMFSHINSSTRTAGNYEADCQTDFTKLTKPAQEQCTISFWRSSLSEGARVAFFDDSDAVSKIPGVLNKALQADVDAIVARAQVRAAQAYRCASPTVLCLHADGTRFLDDQDGALEDGDQLVVVALAKTAAELDTLVVELRGLQRLSSIVETAAVTTAATARNSKENENPPFVLKAKSFTSEVAAERNRAVAVELVNGEYKRAYKVPVRHGRYIADFGISVPFVAWGKRTVTSATNVDQNIAPKAALSAIVFLRGRPKGEVIFHGCDAFGIQIGTDFDFTKSIFEKEYHLGLAWEPVAGFGIGVGVSLVKGEFIPAAGTVLPVVTTPPKQLEYMIRPYFSVFLTTEFITSAKDIATALATKR